MFPKIMSIEIISDRRYGFLSLLVLDLSGEKSAATAVAVVVVVHRQVWTARGKRRAAAPKRQGQKIEGLAAR